MRHEELDLIFLYVNIKYYTIGMKVNFYAVFVLLVACFLGLFVWIFSPVLIKTNSVFYSPLPNFLNLAKNNQVSTINLFLPKIEQILFDRNKIKKPDISAKSALIYDLTTKKTVFEKNANQRLAVASLTKVMTAIIALENKKSDDKYSVKKDNLVGENSMGLSEGEILSLEELLYGLILPSGNDAAEVLAENYILGRGQFIKAMNDKAESLGLKNTHFTNPSGLQGDGDQYSTAYDLFVVANYALSNFPLFNRVVSTFRYDIPQTETHKAFYLENETNLLTSYPGVKGVKTGFTPEADLCLITYLDYQGHKIIGVILGSSNRREEMKELLDYSLKIQNITPPPHD